MQQTSFLTVTHIVTYCQDMMTIEGIINIECLDGEILKTYEKNYFSNKLYRVG